MSVYLGHDVNIYNGNNALIGAAKSCTIHKTVEMIEVADPSNPTTKKFVPARSSWSVTMNHLVTTTKGGIPLVNNSYHHLQGRQFLSIPGCCVVCRS